MLAGAVLSAEDVIVILAVMTGLAVLSVGALVGIGFLGGRRGTALWPVGLLVAVWVPCAFQMLVAYDGGAPGMLVAFLAAAALVFGGWRWGMGRMPGLRMFALAGGLAVLLVPLAGMGRAPDGDSVPVRTADAEARAADGAVSVRVVPGGRLDRELTACRVGEFCAAGDVVLRLRCTGGLDVMADAQRGYPGSRTEVLFRALRMPVPGSCEVRDSSGSRVVAEFELRRVTRWDRWRDAWDTGYM